MESEAEMSVFYLFSIYITTLFSATKTKKLGIHGLLVNDELERM
jgi:hypothetical protein